MPSDCVARTREVSGKRYRYTGMERDEETGMGYHTARYYLSWLGRWGQADPIGIRGGVNLWSYAASSPQRMSDRLGTKPESAAGGSGEFVHTVRRGARLRIVFAEVVGRSFTDDKPFSRLNTYGWHCANHIGRRVFGHGDPRPR
jgi:RHS repeat-associated protein